MEQQQNPHGDLNSLYRVVVCSKQENLTAQEKLDALALRTRALNEEMARLGYLKPWDQDALKQKVAALEIDVRQAKDDLESSREKFHAAKVSANAALGKRAGELTEKLSDAIRNDRQMQTALVDLFLSVYCGMDSELHPCGLSGWVSWEAVIESAFPHPDTAQIRAREAAFRDKHGLPLLASVAN